MRIETQWFFDAIKHWYYLRKLNDINKKLTKDIARGQYYKNKIDAIQSKYADVIKQFTCEQCSNTYFLGQVEIEALNNKTAWRCPNCSVTNVFVLKR